MLSARIDSWLARFAASGKTLPGSRSTRYVDTAAGRIRVLDAGGAGPAVIFVPDGPNVIEHYERLIPLLTPRLGVVCFDMPGFGFSLPSASYTALTRSRCSNRAGGARRIADRTCDAGVQLRQWLLCVARSEACAASH